MREWIVRKMIDVTWFVANVFNVPCKIEASFLRKEITDLDIMLKLLAEVNKDRFEHKTERAEA